MALYHTVNGSPVEVQKHQLMGPVGYTLTGNATVTDGVLGNLDTSSSAYTSSSLPNDYNKIEMVFKLGFNTTATTSGYFPVCGFGSPVSQRRIGWLFSNSESLVFKTSNSADAMSEVLNSSLNPVTTLNNNGFVFVKMLVEKIGANYNVTISASADGTNWINGETGQTDTDPIGGRSVYLLRNTSGAAGGRPTMDLNETYIKVNDKLWFYQPANTKYIVKDGKLVWADPRIYLESSGTQYIDTGIIPTELYTYSFAYSTSSTSNQVLFGQRTSGSVGTSTDQIDYSVMTNGNAKQGMVFGQDRTEISCSLNTKYTLTYADTRTDLSATNSIYLGCFNLLGRASAFFSGKIYKLVISDNNIPIIDLVPVPQGLEIGEFTVPSNGMFDIVNQQFYANQGTGEFTIGRDE